MFRERFYSLRIERNLVWNMEANVVSRDKISLRFHEHRIVYKHAFYTLQRTRGIARAYNLPWCLSNVYKISLSLYTYIYVYYCVAVGRIWGSFSCPSTEGSGRRTHEGLPMHPLGGRELYRVAWLSPGLASGCLLSPRNIFSYASFRRKTYPSFSLSYISLPYVESHTFRTSMFSFLFQSRTPLVSRLTVFFSSFVIDRLSIFSLFPRASDFFFVLARSSLRAFLLFLSFAIVLQTKTFWHGAYSNPPCCGWLLIWLLIYASLWRSSYASSLPSLVPHLSASK